MTVFSSTLSASARWENFIATTAAGLQVRLQIICPDGVELHTNTNCPVCGFEAKGLSQYKKQEIYNKIEQSAIKECTENGASVYAMKLKYNAVLFVLGCHNCSQSDDGLYNKALTAQKLLNSFLGALGEEIEGGQRAIELSTLRQMNHKILSQFSGNKKALEQSIDLILSALIILLDAQGSWFMLEDTPRQKEFMKGDIQYINNYLIDPADGIGLTVKVLSGNIKGTIGVVLPANIEQAISLLPLMADECAIVLEVDHLFKMVQKKMAQIFEAVNSAILVLDKMGNISYANTGFEKLTGYSVLELIGQSVSSFSVSWVDLISQKAAKSEESLLDFIYAADGEKKYINWQLSPLIEEEFLYGWLIIINDRTEYYHWQEAVGKAERFAATSVLLSSLAHELRNPLSAIKGLIQLIGGKRDPESIRSYIDLSVRELDRVTQLLNEFLLLGKPAEKDNQPVCLKTFLEEIMPLLKCEGAAYGVEVVLEIKAMPMVLVDSGQLTQVIMNIVRNAVEVTDKLKQVIITLTSGNGKAFIAIRDSGPGVPDDLKDKLFRPFFTTKKGRGTGLGLSVCQAIVNQHSGEINFWNESAGGAVFNISLPAYEPINLNIQVDIVICIEESIIAYPVKKSLQAAGFQAISIQEENLINYVKTKDPRICILQGLQGQQNLVESIKMINTNIAVVELSGSINYSELLGKVKLILKNQFAAAPRIR